MRARAGGVWCVVFAVAGLTGCNAPPGGTDGSPPIEATLAIHSGEAAVETADGTGDGADGETLAAGDVVTVSGQDALVELTWSDGAVTRLGPDTSFTVGAPGDRLGARGLQSGGVSWNRVSAARDAEEDAAPYVLAVDGASPVSDRGELFVVDCRAEACRIAGTGGGGADGSKTTFRRGLIETEVVGEMPVSWEALMVDPWAEANAALDEAGGLAPVADLFADAEPSRGVLEGTFDVLRTGRERSCSGARCSELVLIQPGETRSLVYTFNRDCLPASGCATSVDTQFVDTDTGAVNDENVPLVTSAETFTWGRDVEGSICLWTYEDGFSTETGHQANSIRWSVTPSKAEIRDGVFVVTELTGTAEASLKIVEHVSPEFPGCEALEVEWSGASDLVLTRRDG
ncbi:hypothetical protein [Microbacterium sp.]|uniref:hypothetical protein n=1 Tax=Microbacterium sp. TaxID=51671 RepID=UPI002E2F4641|nr:hypothetical protein [Microbacterium sp.]HEX5730511.1 hypothetical protein [Microbacterium sp.]